MGKWQLIYSQPRGDGHNMACQWSPGDRRYFRISTRHKTRDVSLLCAGSKTVNQTQEQCVLGGHATCSGLGLLQTRLMMYRPKARLLSALTRPGRLFQKSLERCARNVIHFCWRGNLSGEVLFSSEGRPWSLVAGRRGKEIMLINRNPAPVGCRPRFQNGYCSSTRVLIEYNIRLTSFHRNCLW